MVKTLSISITLPLFLSHFAEERTFKIKVASDLSLKDIIQLLIDRFGHSFGLHLLDPKGNLRPSILVSINRQVIPSQDIDQIHVNSPCSIEILPVAAGG
jgi:sulfur carrier protein ThiS